MREWGSSGNSVCSRLHGRGLVYGASPNASGRPMEKCGSILRPGEAAKCPWSFLSKCVDPPPRRLNEALAETVTRAPGLRCVRKQPLLDKGRRAAVMGRLLPGIGVSK